MPDVIESISRSIPVFFYDFLARVCPGAVLLYFVGLPGRLLLSTKLEAADFAVLAIGGYVIGILLTVISSLVFDGSLELVSHLSKRLHRMSLNHIWDQIDALDRHDERHARLLVKIEAEMTFCQNLFVVFLVLATLQRFDYTTQKNTLFNLSNPVSWIIASTILGAVIHRTSILFRRVHVLTHRLPSRDKLANDSQAGEKAS